MRWHRDCGSLSRARSPRGLLRRWLVESKDDDVPTAERILADLTRLSNGAFAVAVAWHAAVLLATISLLRGWRPSRRRAGAFLAMPLASVSALAFVFGNPFNGSIFAGLATLLLVLALRFREGGVELGPTWTVVLGAGMIAFGCVYPHFLRTDSVHVYLIGAPMGLIPCPTLSLVIGFALVGGGLGSHAWPMCLAAVGMFYGVVGATRLGVHIDLALVVGAAALVVSALLPGRRRSRSTLAAASSAATGKQNDAAGPQ